MKTRILFVLAILGTVAFIGCRPEVAPRKPETPTVTVSEPIVQDVTEYAEFTGKLQSAEIVEIRARVKGFLETASFTDGDVVEKDQILFTIEKEPFEAALAAAKAQKEKTKATVLLTKANLDRAEQLVENRTISREEYQTKRAQYEAALAQELADDAAIRQAEIDLSYTTIKSPIRGLVGRRLVDPGNLVGGDGNTLLTTVTKIDPMYVYFDVGEAVVRRYLNKKKEYEDSGKTLEDGAITVLMQLDGQKGYPNKGILDFIDNVVDPDTGTAEVRGVFPNPNDLMRSGMYARLRIPRELQKASMVVFEEAIQTDMQGKYLLIVGKDDMVERRSVELGTLIEGDGSQMRVVNRRTKPDQQGGIGPGERYVSNGMQRARPGTKVNPKPAGSQPEAEE